VLFLVLVSAGVRAATLLVFGDSLSAAYGIPRDAGWVALLEQRLSREKPQWRVINASVSGETTAGGLARLPAALARYQPDVVLLALGANDGLRGLPVPAMRSNLSAMAGAAQKRGAQVLVAGMRIPPNYGAPYAREFESAFAAVAKTRDAAYVPFLLKGLADKPDLFQDDQLHPTAEAQRIILQNVWPTLRPLLK